MSATIAAALQPAAQASHVWAHFLDLARRLHKPEHEQASLPDKILAALDTLSSNPAWRRVFTGAAFASITHPDNAPDRSAAANSCRTTVALNSTSFFATSYIRIEVDGRDVSGHITHSHRPPCAEPGTRDIVRLSHASLGTSDRPDAVLDLLGRMLAEYMFIIERIEVPRQMLGVRAN